MPSWTSNIPPVGAPTAKKHWYFGVLCVWQSQEGKNRVEKKGVDLFFFTILCPPIHTLFSFWIWSFKVFDCDRFVAVSGLLGEGLTHRLFLFLLGPVGIAFWVLWLVAMP